MEGNINEITLFLTGMVLAAALDEWCVEPAGRRPASVILWVLSGLIWFPVNWIVGMGYVSAIAAGVLLDAIAEWRETGP
jgi:hypothetical protein